MKKELMEIYFFIKVAALTVVVSKYTNQVPRLLLKYFFKISSRNVCRIFNNFLPHKYDKLAIINN